MGRHGRSESLARRICVLFGAAVLLTIAATLAFPSQQMNALHEQVLLLEAKRIAAAAYQLAGFPQPDWNLAQSRVEQYWTAIARRLDLPSPAPGLVRVDRHGKGFHQRAIDLLQDQPHRLYYWRLQRDGALFRLAMAVRGVETDDHPHVLRGIVDVRLPVQRGTTVWNWAVTILSGASGAVLAILTFYGVTQRLVLSPVHRLRRLAERVTTGDTNVRALIKSGDEFEDLAEALNDMLEHLKAAHEEQERINRSLDVRLGDLAETNVALYESSRLKGEFLANVTHELRTPLVSIIGFAELLRDLVDTTKLDRKRLTRYSQNILTSGRNLLDLINDLLDLAKIEAGKLQIHISEIAPQELCEDLIAFIRPIADKRNQQLVLTIAPDLPQLRSDAGRIKQVLFNLLSNAIKFTPTGGRVELEASADGVDHLRLVVRDTGPGISPEDQVRIFEKFRQLDSSATREHAGTGLGLPITRDLLDLLGGSIALESEPGRGSTFIVRLPVCAPRDAPARHPLQ